MKINEMNSIVDKIVNLIRRGYSRGKIVSEMIEDVGIFSKEKLFEIAKCRIKAKEKFGDLSNKLFFDEEGLRYSTPPVIAKYRAERLQAKVIADVSCGVGIQALYFAMMSEKVIAVEKDLVRLELAKLNAESLGIENIEFIHGDALSKGVINRVKADVIFSDPARKPEEPVRTLETLEPSPVKIYQIYRKITDEIAFELPPQISRENIIIDGEKEYTSLDFRLNRLALYTGPLKSCDVSAISLPSKERISNDIEKISLETRETPLRYIYEVDPTIAKADLLENLAGKINFKGFILNKDKRRTLLTSREKYISSFLRCYNLLDFCKFDLAEIKSNLKYLDAGKVTLRVEIDPKKYWNVRKEIERDLSGDRKVMLFKVGDYAIIVEKTDLYNST